MTAIINQKMPTDSKYLQHDDKFLDKLESDLYHISPIPLIIIILIPPPTTYHKQSLGSF